MNKENLILIADSHIREETADEFFAMLARIRDYGPRGVIFLGDIFELWIALDGYESGIHRRFLEWCAESKKFFEVGFIIGNHEFYLERCYSGAFSWLDLVSHSSDGILFIHGDLINMGDLEYLLLRKFLRCSMTRMLLKWTGKTIGPRVSEKVRTSIKTKNMRHKQKLPERYFERYARNARKESIREIYAGHFHEHLLRNYPDAASLEILPSWAVAGEIVCRTPDGNARCAPWRELLPESGSVRSS